MNGGGLDGLRPAAAGSSLTRDSRLAVATIQPNLRQILWDGILTPDGATIAVAMENQADGRISRYISEFSSRTGRAIRTVYGPPGNGLAYANLLWTNASGSVLIAAATTFRKVRSPGAGSDRASSGRAVFGVVRGGRFSPLPGPARPVGVLGRDTTLFIDSAGW